jgi:cell wall-associated NlpC family hydrolase
MAASLVVAWLVMNLFAAAPASADPSAASQPSQGQFTQSQPAQDQASDLQGAQAQAAALQAQLQADGNRLDVLDQQYQAAEQQVQSLNQSLFQTTAKIAVTEATIGAGEEQLRRQALSAYTGSATDSAMAQLFSPGDEHTSLVEEYQHVASANVSDTVDGLRVAEETLSVQESHLQAAEAQAKAASAQLAQSQAEAQALVASQQAALGQVNGQIATLVAQQEASQQSAEAAAFQSRYATVSDAPVSPGAAGAVQAAESQLGVPYVWGGEQPGVGFDCSGLTQWSWGRAGVSIPRTAQEQYDAIVHVPLSQLQPGDLLFWDDGTSSVEHVAMYVGGGKVIQAPETGETVSYASIWTNGLVGAGRP